MQNPEKPGLLVVNLIIPGNMLKPYEHTSSTASLSVRVLSVSYSITVMLFI